MQNELVLKKFSLPMRSVVRKVSLIKFLEQSEREITAFYLTDFLARQFHAFVVEPLQLDKHPELIAMFFGNYTKLIYLAQTENQDLQCKALAAARFLNLEYEYRLTRYGDLETTLKKLSL
jgi:Protein of unknown function (DUF1638)